MRYSRIIQLAALLITGAALIALLFVFSPPERTTLWKEIADFGHVPVFGLLSLVFLGISLLLFRDVISRRWLHYIIAFILTAVLGIITEAAQIPGPRDADVLDWLRDLLGAALFLIFYGAWDTSLLPMNMRQHLILRWLAVGLVAALLILAMLPVVTLAAAYDSRDNAFPHLCTFDAGWEKSFWKGLWGAKVDIVAAPAEWSDTNAGRVGRLTFNPAKYPAFSIREPVGNWHGFAHLAFDVFVPADSHIVLALRVDDIHHDNKYNDRYNAELRLQPGLNHIRIPLESIKRAPISRPMDMSHISSLTLFALSPNESFSVYVDNFRLD